MEDISGKLKEIIGITKEKKQRLQAILSMTEMQREAIEKEDVDLLTGYIQEKQRHIDAIDELDSGFSAIYNGHIREELALGAGGKDSREEALLYRELKDEISHVQGIIGQIYDVERNNSIKGKRAMAGLKSKISHLKAGQKGYDAYNRVHSASDGIYIDQKK